MQEVDKKNIIRNKLATGKNSAFSTYRDITTGKVSGWRFLLYETLTSVLGPLPGGAGFFLRKTFYPQLFKKVGKGFIIGRNVVIRHPDKIEVHDHVTIDDNCLIDARGAGEDGVVLEDGVIINRNCMIQAKSGPIRLGRRMSLGSNSVLVSLGGVTIGEAVLTAGGCYISAGAYEFDRLDMPVMDQRVYTKGPIQIGASSWLGTCVIVLDGVSIGTGAVVGAGSVVTKNIPDYSVVVGVPAHVVKTRSAASKGGGG